MSSPFRCPACNFSVFNRRLTHCEECMAALPEALRFSAHDLDRLARDAAQVERLRRDLAHEMEAHEQQRALRRRSGG